MKKIICVVLAVLFCFSTAYACGGKDGKVCAKGKLICGEWRGMARCNNPHLQDNMKKIVLFIGHDWKVSGRVGDLTIKNGKIEKLKNRARTKFQEEFIISGDLEGTLYSGDEIRNHALSLALNFKDKTAEGQMYSKGVKKGATEEMINNSWNLMYMDRYGIK